MNKKNISLGILLISMGIMWILNDLNIINFRFIYILNGFLDLWPLILIIVGINIIFKNDILNNVLWILFFVIVVFYGTFIHKDYDSNENIQGEDISIEMEEDIISGELDLSIGAASFEIGEEIKEYGVLRHNGKFNYKTIDKNNTRSLIINSRERLNMNKSDNHLFLGLNNNIPWGIDIETGASKSILNLQDIIVEELDLEIGAGSIEINLGDKSPSTNIDIEGGASSIDLNIPNNSGIKIRMDGALNSTNIEGLDLVEEGKYLVSQGFEDSENKFYIDIELGVGSLDINYY